MVIFHRETIEKELSAEEIERQRLHAIQNSEAWKNHAALHKQAGLGDAQLHLAGEAILGEGNDPVRARFGLQQKGNPSETINEIPKEQKSVYGAQHTTGQHSTYTAPGNQPGLWASCNCGAEFKAEEKEGKLDVKAYGVVGSDKTATSYAMASSDAAYKKDQAPSVYTAQQSTTGYTTSQAI